MYPTLFPRGKCARGLGEGGLWDTELLNSFANKTNRDMEVNDIKKLD